MNIFLSLPMSGKSDEEIMEDLTYMRKIIFENPEWFGAEPLVTDNFSNGKDVENILLMQRMNPRNKALCFLGVAIAEMANCDAVLFHPNYKDARGCRVENHVAIEYNLERFYLTKDGNIYKQGEGFISQ